MVSMQAAERLQVPKEKDALRRRRRHVCLESTPAVADIPPPTGLRLRPRLMKHARCGERKRTATQHPPRPRPLVLPLSPLLRQPAQALLLRIPLRQQRRRCFQRRLRVCAYSVGADSASYFNLSPHGMRGPDPVSCAQTRIRDCGPFARECGSGVHTNSRSDAGCVRGLGGTARPCIESAALRASPLPRDSTLEPTEIRAPAPFWECLCRPEPLELPSPKMGPTPPVSAAPRSSPFGADKPVDVSSREKEVAERVEKDRQVIKEKLSMSRTNSRSATEWTIFSPAPSTPTVRSSLSFASAAAKKENVPEKKAEGKSESKEVDAEVGRVADIVSEVAIQYTL
ncbi:hypothetical protein B0H11DRAFT_2409743 [Mycena galericulata]|nr:hypothetical protein B0H11DRAFT_2409743 [Mycena galericulata]